MVTVSTKLCFHLVTATEPKQSLQKTGIVTYVRHTTRSVRCSRKVYLRAKNVTDNWNAIRHPPDAIIDAPDKLLDVLRQYEVFLPELEHLLSGTNKRPAIPWFDKVNKLNNMQHRSILERLVGIWRSLWNRPRIC